MVGDRVRIFRLFYDVKGMLGTSMTLEILLDSFSSSDGAF